VASGGCPSSPRRCVFHSEAKVVVGERKSHHECEWD
jgi:hypothetical protein